MPRLSISDRIAYAAIGALLGSVLCVVLLWLLGVYSNTLGTTGFVRSPAKLIGYVALGFAAIGFVFGSSVGTAVGNTIAAVFEFERAELPPWLIALLAVVAVGVLWYTMQS